MYNILSIILLVSVLCIIQVNALDNLGTFKLDNCMTLKQGCANCSYNNISAVLSPNGTTYLSNVLMTKTNNDYNYTFCNTSVRGEYIVYGFGDLNGDKKTWAYTFSIESIGYTPTITQGILFGVMFVILLIVFIFGVWLTIFIPYEDVKEDGFIKIINWKKYLKWFVFCITYLSFVGISFSAWNISYAYLYFDSMTNFFRYLFIISLFLVKPIFFIVMIFFIIKVINDVKINNQLIDGVRVRDK